MSNNLKNSTFWKKARKELDQRKKALRPKRGLIPHVCTKYILEEA